MATDREHREAILHPLNCEGPFPLPEDLPFLQCVVLQDTVFLGGRVSITHKWSMFKSKDLRSWKKLSDTPYGSYSLAIYNSKIVLVGGKLWDMPTKKLWLSDDGIKWKQSLPPMPTARSNPIAIEIEGSQCLVVAGGKGVTGTTLDVVEVLVQHQWTTVQPLPHPCYNTKPVIHDGNLYILSGGEKVIFYCKLDELLEAALSNDNTENKTSNLWHTLHTPHQFCHLVSFGQHLVAIRNKVTVSYKFKYVMYAYSPTKDSLSSSTTSTSLTTVDSWVQLEDLPVQNHDIVTTVVVIEDLVFVTKYSVYKYSLQVCSDSEANLHDMDQPGENRRQLKQRHDNTQSLEVTTNRMTYSSPPTPLQPVGRLQRCSPVCTTNKTRCSSPPTPLQPVGRLHRHGCIYWSLGVIILLVAVVLGVIIYYI